MWYGCISASSGPRITRRRWSRWHATWPRPLGGYLPGRRFIASPTARGTFFRRRTGKRGYAANPTRVNNDWDTRSAEEGHAGVEGGDMHLTKERNLGKSGTDEMS